MSINVLRVYFYKHGMGTGKVVFSRDIPPSLDEAAPPGSLGRDIIDHFCAPARP